MSKFALFVLLLLLSRQVALAQATVMGDQVVAITDQPLEEPLKAQLAKLSLKDVRAALKDKGFELVTAGPTTYAFAPKLWAEEAIKRMSTLYAELESLMARNSVFSGNASPAIAQFVENNFSRMGFSNPVGGLYTVMAGAEIGFTDGSRFVTYRLPSGDDDSAIFKGLDNAPLKQLSPEEWKRRRANPPPVIEYGPPALTRLYRTPFGGNPNDAKKAASDLSEAARMLAERYAKVNGNLAEIQERLLGDRTVYRKMEEVKQGMAMSALSEELQHVLPEYLTENFQSLGFESKDDALAFFARARVQSKLVNLRIIARRYTPGEALPSYVAVGLPPP